MTRRILAILLAVIVAAIGSILAFDKPVPPKAMASVENALDDVDFTNLPAKRRFMARDGASIFFRAYPAAGPHIAVLVHGSSGTSASMHVLAQALQARHITTYALAMRGHDGSGQAGDISYIGQLDDDLADFMRTLPPRSSSGHRILLGFSSGGGFALRFAGGANAHLFDRFLFIAPALPHGAPAVRPYDGVGWVDAAVPRIVILSILERLRLPFFQSLPVLAFAVPPEMRAIQTVFYSYRLFRNFAATAHYRDDLKHAPGAVRIVIGEKDEFFYPERFAPLLRPVRPDLGVTIMPRLNHMDMIHHPVAVAAIAAMASQ